VFDFTGASIKDIAPTVTNLLGVYPDAEWEGKSLLK
jgi:bisphosphoglycerate-independent phosphoglycerate mutase (AlkP superfamily)